MVEKSSSKGISVVILTLNEEANLPQCLRSLTWCDDIIAIDSFSTDRTEAMCEAGNVRIYKHEFDGFGNQRNWVLNNVDIKHEWVLFLDADESVPEELKNEMLNAIDTNDQSVSAYRVARRFYMWNRWLKYSSLYPSYVVRLVRKSGVRYVNRGHAETQTVVGDIGTLKEDLIDSNQKGIEEWFNRQNRYSTQEAIYELSDREPLHFKGLIFGDSLARRKNLKRLVRSIPFRPSLYFLYSYIFRLGFLDGKAGYQFCRMKSVYQAMIVVKKFDQKLKN